MSSEQKSYESDYGRCAECGCRRPQKAMNEATAEQKERGKTRFKVDVTGVCQDTAWCEQNRFAAVPDRRIHLCKECSNPIASGSAGPPKEVHEECKPVRYKVQRAIAADRREAKKRRAR